MKYLRSLLIGAFLLVGTTVSAAVTSNFNQDHMITTNYSIIVHSPFDTTDLVTSYSEYGFLQWEVKLNARVLSMKIKDGLLYIFSGSRVLNKTFLTCVDPVTGIILWERP